MDTPSKECVICNKTFYNLRINKHGQRIRKYTKAKWETAKYCSHKCYWIDMKGKPGNNKGTGEQVKKRICKICNKEFERDIREGINNYKKRKYCSHKCSSKSKIGIKRPEMAEILKKNRKHHRGEKHWNWKGGITPYYHKLRQSKKYIEWRNEVYERDNWTCRECNEKLKSKTIVAHHIKSFKKYHKLRFKISNGKTLCRKCHKKVHKKIGYETRFKK